jgi:hypothetical protein
MSFDPRSNRLDPRRLFPAFETDEGEKMFEALDASRFSSAEESANDLSERDFDLALEQIVSERCCVCPLCGALVGSDGSVLS